MKDTLSTGNQNGSIPLKWLGGFLVFIGLIAAAVQFLPGRAAPVPARTVVRGKIPAPPVALPAGAPARAEDTAASDSGIQVREQAAAPEEKTDLDDLRLSGGRADPTTSAEGAVWPEVKTPASAQTAASVQGTPTGQIDPQAQDRQPGMASMQTAAGPPVVETALPTEVRAPKDVSAGAEKSTAAALTEPAAAAAPKIDLSGVVPAVQALFTIQVGAYRTKAYADEWFERLQKAGYAPFIFEVQDARKVAFFTVRIGQFASRESAMQAVHDFRKKEKVPAVIRRSGAL